MSKTNTPKSSLEELEPEGLIARDEGWQQRKSAQTRIWILEAAIDCLGEVGYSKTTTQLIAQKAEISRGAMLHHYATKIDLIEGVIEYTFFKRMKYFTEQVARLSDTDRVDRQVGLEVLWHNMQSREYSAYLELLVASRTDEELGALFQPIAKKFDSLWMAELLKVLPEWEGKEDRLQLAIDFAHSTTEGLVLNRDIWPKKRRQEVRALLNQTIIQFRDGALNPAELPDNPKRK